MKKSKTVTYAEFRQLLLRLGYKEKQTDTSIIFHHPDEGLILFRSHGNDEQVEPLDLFRTRKFLDLRGLLEEADFDAFTQRANKPA